MAGPFGPSAGRGHRGGAPGVQGSAGRGRGAHPGSSSTHAVRGSGAPRAARARGRGRGSMTWTARGRGRGAAVANNTTNGTHQAAEGSGPGVAPGVANSPFAQLNQQKSVASPFGGQPAQQSPFSKAAGGTGQGAKNPFAKPATAMNRQTSEKFGGAGFNAAGSVDNASLMQSYQERFDKLKIDQVKQRERAIRDGQMADPNQPTSLNQAITPVGTCTSMCPEFESVERIVQKAVDKCEKHFNPATNQLEILESKMVKRFRRAAAGNDEQLPSDIRTPQTLLQTMNYLIRHVINGSEPLAAVHMFIWNRTRSIRNDFSVQQLTNEEDVKMAVTCLERIARFHIVSLHLLSSPANTEPFDRHQEREQLNNTMLSLMYYYDDNRGRIHFPNEDEFRAYHILFSIHDQRPDLEARVSRWPVDLLASPRVQVALELFAAACNTWEPQGALDARRPNAIAQGLYARFFNIIDSPSVSYLMACVAEIYFNHIRQTAIRAIWKAYCRTPLSQQPKNDHWTVKELTKVLHFDDDEQTVAYCNAQGLDFADNANGESYLNWGNRHVDSVDFAPSSEHSFSETYVESKRSGRNLVAIILGMSIKEAARMGMIDPSHLPHKSEHFAEADAVDEDLFVSDADNQTPAPVVEYTTSPTPEVTASEGVFSEKPAQPAPAGTPPFTQPALPSTASNPFAAFQPSKTSPLASSVNEVKPATTSAFPPPSNPFATSFPASSGTSATPSPFAGNEAKPTTTSAFPPSSSGASAIASPFAGTDAKPATTSAFPPSNPFAPSPPASTGTSATPSPFTGNEVKPTVTSATPPPSNPFATLFPASSGASATPRPFAGFEAKPTTTSALTPSNPFAASLPANSGQSALFAPAPNPSALTGGPEKSTEKTEEPAVGTSKAPSLFQTNPPSSQLDAPNKPAFSFTSPPGSSPSPFTSSTSFTFSKPAAPTPQTQTPATTPLSQPGLFTPVSAATDKIASVSSNVFTSEPPAAKSPFAAAPPFSFTKPAGHKPVEETETDTRAKVPGISPASGQPFSPFPAKDMSGISGPPKAAAQSPAPSFTFESSKPPQPSQKAETPVTTASTPEKPSPAVSAPPAPSSGFPPAKPSEPSVSAPVTAPSAPKIQPGPPSVDAAASASGTRKSISRPLQMPPSPPPSLFEALRRPQKIFDATSSGYSPDTATSAPARPLFPTLESEDLGQQASSKRQLEVTDTATGKRKKRRPSVKGKSSVSSTDGASERPIHFEESHDDQRDLPKQSEALINKRRMDDQAEDQDPSTKLSKDTTKDDRFPFKYSVYDAVNRPMPKLPILEKLEAKLARVKELTEPKPPTPEQLEAIEEARQKRARQVDEDELALNRARILAETLRRGPGIFDGFTGFKPAIGDRPWNSSIYKPADRGYEVHVAGDEPVQYRASYGPQRSRRSTTRDPRDRRRASSNVEAHRPRMEDRAKVLKTRRGKADAKEKTGVEHGVKNPRSDEKDHDEKDEEEEQGWYFPSI
ncbi:SAC3/GANP/Nin1/mts3/eIF-3 p25 [Penicillium sp. DV-2018c]|nr:SAC3/GANP/Nin1/mts3/eIF-3 p25 [Penicillium sp. DV-2018c]